MSTTPANWYPDSTGRHQMRYWDGTGWTEHVSDNGIQGVDPLQPKGLDKLDSSLTIGDEGDAAKIQQQLHGDQKYRSANVQDAAFHGGGTIFTEPILVVNQKAKLIELNNQYSVFNKDGQQIAAVNQVGQSAAKKAIRLLSNLDQFMTHKLEITDTQGRVQMRITRPAKVMKSTVIVSDNVPANTTLYTTPGGCGVPAQTGGSSVGGTTAIVTATAATLASGASFQLTFCVTINP